MKWDDETDFLVVGSGAGGMVAALVANHFAADTLVVEKSGRFGGTTAVSGGNVWIPCSPQALAMGYRDTPEEALTYLQSTVGEEADDRRLRAYVETGPELLRFLEANTRVRFVPGPLPDYYSNLPGGKDRFRAMDPVPIHARQLGAHLHTLRPPHPQTLVAGVSYTTGEIARILRKERGWLRAALAPMLRQYLDIPFRMKSRLPRRLTLGSALAARCRLSMQERSIPLRLDSAMQELIVVGGRVAGAMVRREGRDRRIKARKGVLIAAGGFSSNPEMRSRYLAGAGGVDRSVAPGNNNGDGIRVGIDAGAATALMDEAWWIPVYRLRNAGVTCGMFMERSFPGCLVVNAKGERFFNDATNYDEAGRAMVRAAREEDANSPSYFVFDGRFRRSYVAGPLQPAPGFVDPFLGADVRDLLVKADSIAELAGKLGIAADALSASVERFNGFAETGVDRDFGRGNEFYERHYSDPSIEPNSTLAALTKPPFYAIPVYPGDIGTKGGLVTDADARVLKADGNAIEGLYATGNSAASVMGRSYPGGGATIGPSIVFGARAVMHACGKQTL